jgi:hypothetical protein
LGTPLGAAADCMGTGYEADVAGVGEWNPRAAGTVSALPTLGNRSSISRWLAGAAGGGHHSSRRDSRDATTEHTPTRKGSKGGAGTPGSSGGFHCSAAS